MHEYKSNRIELDDRFYNIIVDKLQYEIKKKHDLEIVWLIYLLKYTDFSITQERYPERSTHSLLVNGNSRFFCRDNICGTAFTKAFYSCFHTAAVIRLGNGISIEISESASAVFIQQLIGAVAYAE